MPLENADNNCNACPGTESSLLRSFWIGGFEGADHRNGAGQTLDPAAASGHIEQVERDYELLARVGIHTVRESLGWRLTETARGFDFSRLRRAVVAARRYGTQILWTLSHYGVPPDVDYLDERFVERFVRFAEAAAREIKRLSRDSDPASIYTPINEINFLAYAVAETGLIFPYRGDPAAEAAGFQIKRRLVRASLAAIEAIRAIEPRARIMIVDPVCHVVAPEHAPELAQRAALVRQYQWQSWDMITGRMEPELGGHPEALDIVGVNHYHSGQWEIGTERRLFWHLRDSRRAPLSTLLAEVHERYRRPVVLAETSHVGQGRAQWFDEMAGEVFRARKRGVPVEGFCLYPILDRCDWEAPDRWHNSGLWDVPPADGSNGGARHRLLNLPYARALKRWQRRFADSCAASSSTKASMQTLIVFSHLRWDFVYQRPQHLLSRLAQHYRVLFFEEPVRGKLTPFLERFAPCRNVEVLRPHTTISAPGFHDDQLPELRPLLAEYLRDFSVTDYWVWFYTPMALPLLAELTPRAVIYDCMDELSAFKDAPRQMMQRETALMKRAQLVLTGGPSLYAVKRALHGNVRCFPSAVDAEHFSPNASNNRKRREHDEADRLQAAIAQPRLGFFGVIDERFDAALIAAVADADSNWHVVIVGPVVKIDPQSLPKRANIHWLGQQPYELLPHLVAQWDVCLLPFARNASTRFISPTKTLEYMAAEKPIVSTPIQDVISLYGDAVAIVTSTAEFVAACKAALAETDTDRQLRIDRMRAHVGELTWDRTARAIHAEIEAVLHQQWQRQDSAAQSSADEVEPALIRVPARAAEPIRVRPVDVAKTDTLVPTLIVGAGPTGLAAAYQLGAGSLLVERESTVGGWCRSVVDNGFTFDHAGHIMFSNDPYVLSLYETLLGDNVHWQNREAWIFSKGVYTRYPFQGSLHGLPPKVLKECIVGAIEARFGPLKDDGVHKPVNAKPPANFEEFIYKVWGAGVAKHFAIPYNRKLWAVPLDSMETSWLGGRVPLPDLDQMIEGALEPAPAPMGPNARFGYPLRGGFQALMNGFLPHLRGRLMLNTPVISVSPRRRAAILGDGRKVRYESLISTMSLPALVAACGDEAPADVRAAARALRYASVRCVNLGIARENLTDKHWIYYPEDTVFHRIFVQGNASPYCNAPGGFGITCEITYSPSKPLPADGADLIERARQDCVRIGMLREDDQILAANQVDMPCAYVVYDHVRHANVELIRNWLAPYDIVLAGRYSEWEYYNSDHAFIAGKRAADKVLEKTRSRVAQGSAASKLLQAG